MGAHAGTLGTVAVAGTLEPFLGPLTGLVVDAAIFLVVVVATYVLYKAAIAPLVGRLFDRQGLDEHARRPLQKIVAFLVLFAASRPRSARRGIRGSCARWRRSPPRRRSRSASRSRT